MPTLSEIIAQSEQLPDKPSASAAQQRVKAEQEWWGAIAALNTLLRQTLAEDVPPTVGAHNLPEGTVQGTVLSGPLPVLDQPDLVSTVSAWTFTVDALSGRMPMPFQLLPAADHLDGGCATAVSAVSLLPQDPLAAEQFCLVLTPYFSLVMALGDGLHNHPGFYFSFDPEVVWQGWIALRTRLMMTSSHGLQHIEHLVQQFAPVPPDYRLVAQFSRLLLAHLPTLPDLAPQRQEVVRSSAPSAAGPPSRESVSANHLVAPAAVPAGPGSSSLPSDPAAVARAGKRARPAASFRAERNRPLERLAEAHSSPDTELLQAIAHEVRTPLSTIRTLTRLLLRRHDLSPDVIKRLELIDRECTEQIDRFGLIFRAVELETNGIKRTQAPLASISLAQVFQQNVPRWQKQASQHSLTLDVLLPQKLPLVVSDPTMLDQVLTGLIDRITRSLPPGSHIQLHVTLAGHQLKLQFQSSLQPHADDDGANPEHSDAEPGFTPGLKALGQLLMFQPETGSLSLSLAVTKNLFQALGGKLIVRQRPQQGEVLTIFLPLETRKSAE